MDNIRTITITLEVAAAGRPDAAALAESLIEDLTVSPIEGQLSALIVAVAAVDSTP